MKNIAKHRNIRREQKFPNLRFPGYIDNWIEKKIGNVFIFKQTNSLSRDSLNYDNGIVKNIHYGDIHTKFQTIFDISREKVPYINSHIDISNIKMESYCQVGDIVIADASEDYEDVGKAIEISNLQTQKVVAGLHTYLARPKHNLFAPGFLAYLMKSRTIRLQIMILAQGSKVYGISSTHLAEILFKIPSLPEQQKIAAFLSAVDKKIALLTRKKALLEQYKKGVMQKLFSQEIRFKDDNGNDFPDWEEKRLGDFATFLKGKGLSKSDIILDGNQPCIRYGELYTLYSEVISVVYSFSKKDLKELVISKANDVIIPSSGETNIDIATASCVLQGGIAIGGDINIIRSQQNGIFLSYYLNNAKKKDIACLAQGNSVVHLYSTHLKTLKIFLPCVKEQNKIAKFLSNIDNARTLINKQIIQTQHFKKGLLQKMFV